VSFDVAGLLGRWYGLVGSGPAQDAAGRRLLDRWAETHRAYHTVAHLHAVLERLDELVGDGVPVSDAARLAAWWHDAVYDPERGDNEARSAELAATTLTSLSLDSDTIAEVVRLVGLTAGHRPEGDDIAGQALCDADLAVLGAPAPDYRAYAAAVRLEYRHLSDAAFGSGRTAVLAELLARTDLYATPPGRRRWDAAARANLAAELAELAELGGVGGVAGVAGVAGLEADDGGR
jgi:predicted metal-dependent HD superfamily phosphohydrolase